MKRTRLYLCFYFSAIAVGISFLLGGGQVINGAHFFSENDSTAGSLILPGEVHLKNIKQLTFDGENAEAYFSLDGTKLSMQRTPRGGDVRPDIHNGPQRTIRRW